MKNVYICLGGSRCTTSNPGPFGIEAAREKALVKSGHVTPQILDIAKHCVIFQLRNQGVRLSSI